MSTSANVNTCFDRLGADGTCFSAPPRYRGSGQTQRMYSIQRPLPQFTAISNEEDTENRMRFLSHNPPPPADSRFERTLPSVD